MKITFVHGNLYVFRLTYCKYMLFVIFSEAGVSVALKTLDLMCRLKRKDNKTKVCFGEANILI